MQRNIICILLAGFVAFSQQSDSDTVKSVHVEKHIPGLCVAKSRLALRLSNLHNRPGMLGFSYMIFRHGARTPALIDLYPNDPYKLDAFLPMGYGELTNEGKRQEYKLGKMLRKRYNTLLGEIFYTGMVNAQSTDYSRTKMSAQLLLAGLFPPAPSQRWDDELPWIPVPVEYEKYPKDYLMIRPNDYCPKYKREYQDALQSENAQSFLKHNQENLEYISRHAGKEYRTVEDGFGIFHTLTAEYTMNLTLPDWTKKIFPETVTEFAIKRGELENLTPSMRRLNGGRMLQHVVRRLVESKDNSLKPSGPKIYIYSGHDYNVVNILSVLNIFKPHFPYYSSSVVIELHHFPDENFGVKILHSKSSGEDYEDKQLDGCEIMCPLETFLNITRNLIPTNYTAECESNFDLDSYWKNVISP